MRVSALVVCGVLCLSAAALVAQEPKATAPAKKTAAKTAPSSADAALIKKAMTAAPASIAKEATIVAMDANMKMRTVRKGTNGFTCAPDPDPMCADQNAMAWLDAYLNKKDPPKDKIGFVYMLAGDSGASNTDPFADKETPTNNWVKSGPHVMIVGAKGMTPGYPHDAKADPAKAYVMWAGSPYEHVMLPVK
jgi:hypothetical protein